jgi:chlorophyll(ide) b reductase
MYKNKPKTITQSQDPYYIPTRSQHTLNVVILGGTRGLGAALVNKFYEQDHNVLFTSRTRENIRISLETLKYNSSAKAIGIASDVSCLQGVMHLKEQVTNYMPDGVDIWVVNAAVSDGNTPFVEHSYEKIQEIVKTNLMGNALVVKLALELTTNTCNNNMMHIFNIAGAGSNGAGTPDFSLYGSTKAGVSQLTKSLRHELKDNKSVGLHIISPGMMPTELLSANASLVKKRIFNIICEHPDVVAAFIYTNMMRVVDNDEKESTITYLGVPRILYHLATFHKRMNRFYNTDEKQ